MGGQVLGGGVVILVAMLLWGLYLMPSILRRARYDAAERNALRLNRALRVLAETSEAPEEVHVELTTRQARVQQKAARRAQAEVERLRRERDEIAAENARLARERARAHLEEHRDRLEAERVALARRDAERAVEAQRRADARELDAQMRVEAQRAAAARDERRQARSHALRSEGLAEALEPRAMTVPTHAQTGPRAQAATHGAEPMGRFERAERALARQARARRRLRLAATLIAAAGLALLAWGVWLGASGAPIAAWLGFAAGGASLLAVGALVLRRMAAVAHRDAEARTTDAAADERAHARAAGARTVRRGVPQLIDAADRGWTPRRIPAPLSSTVGSSTATAADARAARELLLSAAREEALQGRAEQMSPGPVPLADLRAARGQDEATVERVPENASEGAVGAEAAAETAEEQKPASRYASIGYVDEAENERHMREFLARRAG